MATMEAILRTLTEQQQVLAQQVKEQQQALAQQVKEQGQRAEEQQKILSQMVEQLKKIDKGKSADFEHFVVGHETRTIGMHSITKNDIGDVKKPSSLTMSNPYKNAHKVFDEMSERTGVEVTHHKADMHGKEVIDHPIQPKLEAAKKIRSYISISSDEIFEKWERGLCELCDEPFSLGHKCKKISSNYMILLVDEEEETISSEMCHEKCSIDDALQLFEENPKRTTSIKQVEWLGEDKEDLLADSKVVPSKQLIHSNPHNGLRDKSSLGGDDKSDSRASQEQNSNAQQALGETPKRNAVKKSYRNPEHAEACVQLDQVKTSKELGKCDVFDKLVKGNWYFNHYLFEGINQTNKELIWLPFELDWKSITSLNFNSIGANLGLLFTQNHMWEWDGYSCSIPFDPGGMQYVSQWLPTDIYMIHNLEAISVVFDPGKMDLLVNGGVDAILVGHNISTTKSMAFLVVWHIENHSTSKLEVVIVVFDPGGKVINKGGHKVSYLMLSFMEGVAWHLLRSRNPVHIERGCIA